MNASRPDTTTLTFTDGHNRRVKREIKQTLDLRQYLGTPGYPWLALAANPHLSLWDLLVYLDHVNETTPGVQRSRSWIQRRRWLFLQPSEKAKAPIYDPAGNMPAPFGSWLNTRHYPSAT